MSDENVKKGVGMTELRTLKEVRESKGITKKHIYSLLGISRQTLDNKESMKTQFSALEVQKLCSEYNVDILDLKL